MVRTWAPRGKTPVLRYSYRREHLSVAGALTVSPRRQRIGLYLQIKRGAFNSLDMVSGLRQLCVQHPGGILVVWDGAPIHKGEPIRKLLRCGKRIHLERFPGYAPQLNPQEPVWSQIKCHQLANFCPPDLDQLEKAIQRSARRIRRRPALKRSFFQACEPPLPLDG